ncbi:MAG TPA: hypothetical protein VI643_06945, partial [Planctomycetota bacterium]|nr:hypothetical protein [Planctomycetota bacterium]
MRRVVLALALAGCAPDEDLEARLLEQAREIRRLRQLNESLREEPDAGEPPVAPIPGPGIPVDGVVIAIARDYGFFLAALDTPGAADEVKIGHEFAVMRGEARLARGEVTKLIKEGVPKIQIKASNPADLAAVRVGDRVSPVREVPVREPDGAQVTGV